MVTGLALADNWRIYTYIYIYIYMREREVRNVVRSKGIQVGIECK